MDIDQLFETHMALPFLLTAVDHFITRLKPSHFPWISVLKSKYFLIKTVPTASRGKLLYSKIKTRLLLTGKKRD
jgi:hypothetical protein